jgi:transcriptional regulator with XRE-family HTH domain
VKRRCNFEGKAYVVRDRVNAGLNQKELARQAGIRVEALCRIETGRHLPSVATIEKIDGSLKAATAKKRSTRRFNSNWNLNQVKTDGELKALRQSAQTGIPFGQTVWQQATAKRFGLESTLRRPGRPPQRGRTR